MTGSQASDVLLVLDIAALLGLVLLLEIGIFWKRLAGFVLSSLYRRVIAVAALQVVWMASIIGLDIVGKYGVPNTIQLLASGLTTCSIQAYALSSIGLLMIILLSVASLVGMLYLLWSIQEAPD